jgi:hypothetical protein
MTSPVLSYQEEMYRNLGFFANWLPGDPIEIGAVGILSEGRFRRVSSLRELKVKYNSATVGTKQNVQFTSTKGTTIAVGGGTSVLEIGKVSIEINFSTEGAFVFHANGLQAERLENLKEVGDKILELYRVGMWEKQWFLIEACHHAQSVTIIVSQDSSASVNLNGSAEAGLSFLSLADPKLDLKATSSRGKLFQVIGAKGVWPLYSCLRVQSRFFGAPKLAPTRGIGSEGTSFERPGINQLLES